LFSVFFLCSDSIVAIFKALPVKLLAQSERNRARPANVPFGGIAGIARELSESQRSINR
jgi:hypothetical protein